MELSEQQTNRLKEIEFEIFKVFIEICKKLNLKYYVVGGTLLGAVRHKGFIPWDDDIDVGMPRADYEIFMEKGQELLPQYYFLQTHKTDKGWLANFAKIRDSRTTYIETSRKNCKMNHGVFIDIFPLDYCPTKKYRWFRQRLLKARVATEYFFKRSSKRKIIDAILKIIYPSTEWVVNKLEKLIKNDTPAPYMSNWCGAWGLKEVVPSEWFGDGVALDFEGIKVQAPTGYKNWLTQVYGDFMQLPPIEKRKGHHYTEVVDLDKSYTEYTQKGE